MNADIVKLQNMVLIHDERLQVGNSHRCLQNYQSALGRFVRDWLLHWVLERKRERERERECEREGGRERKKLLGVISRCCGWWWKECAL